MHKLTSYKTTRKIMNQILLPKIKIVNVDAIESLRILIYRENDSFGPKIQNFQEWSGNL